MKLYLSTTQANTDTAKYRDNTKYTNNTENVPLSERHVFHEEKTWQMHYSGSKDVSGWKYFTLVIKSVAMTVFSFGFLLFSTALQDNWSTIWHGKKVRTIYIEANREQPSANLSSSVNPQQPQTNSTTTSPQNPSVIVTAEKISTVSIKSKSSKAPILSLNPPISISEPSNTQNPTTSFHQQNPILAQLFQKPDIDNIIPDNLAPKFTGLSDDLKEEIQTFLTEVESLAPDANRTINCVFEDVEYKIWWNSAAKAANVQIKANFLGDTQEIRQKNKLGIKYFNDQLVYFVNNKAAEEPSSEKEGLLQALIDQVKTQKKEYDALKELENKFNPQCLNLLLKFLLGPLGTNFRYNSSIKSQSNSLLPFGSVENISCWMKEENQTVVATRNSLNQPGNVTKKFINFQTNDSYNFALQTDKLGILLNTDGTIASIYIDGKPADASAVFGVDSIWNKRLTLGINQFLEANAIKNYNNFSIAVHPLSLSQRPEAILKRLCNENSFSINNRVIFLSDTLEAGPGIDAGGPKRQLMTDLSRYLLDGSKSRLVRMDSEIPVLSKDKTDAEIEILRNLGKMISACFASPEFPTGRVLPDHYFGLLKDVLGLEEPLSDHQIVLLSEKLCDVNEIRWMWKVYKGPRDLTEKEKNIIMDLFGMCGEDELPQEPTEIKELIKTYLLSSNNFKNKILAAHIISQGIEPQHRESIKSLTKAALSSKIQGEAFSRINIAARINYTGNIDIVRKKANWLKEIILDEKTSENWVKALLQTITGTTAVTANTTIKIVDTDASFCRAHTCSKMIEVPNLHVTNCTPEEVVRDLESKPSNEQTAIHKQCFLDNLELTMKEIGYDMG